MVLPLFVPQHAVQTVSASFVAGYNNSFATVSAALFSVAVFSVAWFLPHRRAPGLWQQAPGLWQQGDTQRLSPGFVAVVVLGTATVLALCGWIVAASHSRYLGDAGYLIEQATVKRDTGRALYTQLEFAYGPLLLLPEMWISPLLGCSMTAAYFITFVFEAGIGLLMLAFLLNEIPMRGSLRKPALLILAFGSITPHLGLNDTFFRFASPFFFFLMGTRSLGTRSRSFWRCALLLSVGEVIAVLISPELGLAMSVGILAFGFLRTWQLGWPWLVTAVLPVVTLATLLETLGRPYLRMAASFSRGALNLPIGPYPHLLVFLFALVWLVPVGLGRTVLLRDGASARWLGVYAMGLAFLPAALGRCDPLHVLFNSIGILLLSLAAVSYASPRARRLWLSAIAVLALWNQFVNERLFELRSLEVLRQTVLPHVPFTERQTLAEVVGVHRRDLAAVILQARVPEDRLDAAFAQSTGSAPVATPIEVSPAIEDALKRTGQYVPGYYAFWVDQMNPTSEQRSIEETNRSPFLLLPVWWKGDDLRWVEDIHLFQGYRLPYRMRHPLPYLPGMAFERNLREHWVPVRPFGPYMLYRQVEPTAGP